MALFRRFFYRKPPDGLLEISERVFVFDYCFTTDVLEDREYKAYMTKIVESLREYSPDSSFMVFNFREGENQSPLSHLLSEYDMTVMDYPRHYENCPLLAMETIHHFLRSGESWLSLGQQNMVLMHCERGGWPVLAFMLAALLIYRKQYTSEQKTLDMTYKQAPHRLFQLISPLNPLPSQLRYLQYVSRRNVVSEWPPQGRALTLDCIILRFIPNMDGEGGCRPIFRIFGQDPLTADDRTPKLLYSTPKRSRIVRYYKQEDSELVKIDIRCHVQGDVVLECLSLDNDFEREMMVFRVMFNTAFIRSNILIVNCDEIDTLWSAKNLFPKDFRTEVLFSEMDATAAILPIELPDIEVKGLPVEAFAKVQEIFSNVDLLGLKSDEALSMLQEISTHPERMDGSPVVTDKINLLRELCSEEIKKKPTTEGLQKIDNLLEKWEQSPPPGTKEKPSSVTWEDSLVNNQSEESELDEQPSPSLNLSLDLNKPIHSKFIPQRRPHSSLSAPASHCNSLQGSPVPLSRYHSAPSLLGITTLLHDDKEFENKEINHHVRTLSQQPCLSKLPPFEVPLESNKKFSSLPIQKPFSALLRPPPLHQPIPSHTLVPSPSFEKLSLTAARPDPTPPTTTPSLRPASSTCTMSSELPPPSPHPRLESSPTTASSKSSPSSSPTRATSSASTCVIPHPPPPLAKPISRPSSASLPASSPCSPPKSASSPTMTSSKPLPPPLIETASSPSTASSTLLVSLPPPLPFGPASSPSKKFSTALVQPAPAPLEPASSPSTESSIVFVQPPSPPLEPASSPSTTSSIPQSPLAPPEPPSSSEPSLAKQPPPPTLPPSGPVLSHRISSISPSPPPSPPPVPTSRGGIALSTPPQPLPPPPPPPPPRLAPSLATLPPPPPPPLRDASSHSVVSFAASPPPPPPRLVSSLVPPLPLPPPPPPLRPAPSHSVASLAPPPPPLCPGHASSTSNTSSSMPQPPPPPPPSLATRTSPKNSMNTPSAPPPQAPSGNGLLKTGLHSHSVGSNVKIPPVPGPPSIKKGRLPSRVSSRAPDQPKKIPLKPYHWLKLTRVVSGSLWAEAQKSDEASKAPEIDIFELESLFAAAVPSSNNGNIGGKSSRASGPKVEKVNLIDLRRAYNCEIMLTKVKVPLPDLMSSILTLDDTALDIDQVENLIKFCPTKEEIDVLKNYKDDPEKLGKCEQFFLEMMKVPRVESKLKVFAFKLHFATQVYDLRKNLNTVNSVAEEIRNSVKLKRIMQTILSLGNALNHGTARGSAVGFRLDSLLKLTDTRARNNKMTLMHYLCKVVAEKLPELLDFPNDLISLEASTKIQLKYLAEEMQAISKGLEKVIQELTVAENDGYVSENFCKILKEFLGFAEGKVRSLASLYSGVGRNADALALYFGEDPARTPFEQVVSTLLNFVRMFVHAREENKKQIELEKKKAQKEAENEAKLSKEFAKSNSQKRIQSSEHEDQ